MKKSLVIFAFLFLKTAQAATLSVCPDCLLHSIKTAVQKAKAGDRIQIHAGVYEEGAILIDKPLHVTGVRDPVIDGGNKGHVFYIRADHVTIENLTIRNSGASDISELAGIRVEESRSCVIRDNHFQNNTYGVYLAKVDGCEVRGNTIHGEAENEVSSGNGIHLWYSQNIHVAENTIQGHRDGLYLEFADHCRVENNKITNNIRYGLHFMFSHENQYLFNLFSKNQTGVAVMYSHHIQMRGNRFEKSWGRSSYGLLLKDIVDSLIEQNDFKENTIGIYADGSNRNRFRKNSFSHNGWAVNLLGSTDSNVFEENNFISNYFDVATNSKDPSNTFTKNYWDDYRGYDLNRDGWGDVPFRPMKMFGLWVGHYPELLALFGSPVIDFLEVAERAFPVLTPKSLQDSIPSMKPVRGTAQ